MTRKAMRRNLGWFVVLLFFLPISCKKPGEPPPKNQEKGEARKEPAGSQSVEEDVLGKYQFRHKTGTVKRPLTAALPRKAFYKGLSFTVTRGTISDEPPPGKKRRAGAEHVYAYLDVSMQNRTKSSSYSGISPDLLKLSLGGEEFGSPLTENWLLELKPQVTEKVTLVFGVPRDTTWERAVLVISQAKEEPEKLALTGPAPAPRYPLSLKLPAQREVKAGELVCKLKSVTLDVEHEQKRVAEGKRYLKLAGSLEYRGPLMSTGFSGDRQLRLFVAGEQAEAVSYPLENLTPKTPKAFEAVYLIPAGTQTAEFRVEWKEGETAKVHLELKGKKE
jgi:hypothetical protein